MSRFTSTSSVIVFLVLCTFLLAACGGQVDQPSQQPTATSDATNKADLRGVKDYLQSKTTALKGYTKQLQQASDTYYALAKGANFDYSALLAQKKSDVIKELGVARDAWVLASPVYEQMEGIVAGEPTLSQFDLILDAGVDGATGGEDVAPVDVKLPDGQTLAKPGNLFGMTETTLWGTEPRYTVGNVSVDFNGDGKKDFGDALPDANVLKGGVDALDKYASDLHTAAGKWEPTVSDLFSALTANVPTIGDFFGSWKSSRFVAGNTGEEKDFAVISRLSDIADNITSWQTMYQGISPVAQPVDASRDSQIVKGFEDLKTYVDDIAKQEHNGKRYTPAEADLLSVEAQRRADDITGQITQLAAKLNIRIKQ